MRLIAVGLALAACHCESGPTPARTSTPLAVESASAMGSTHMAAHLAAASALQAAIAQGRLVDAREQADWFATHDMEVPAQWRAYVDVMRDAAVRIKAADGVASAGLELGKLGRACGSCHEAQHARLVFATSPSPPDGSTLEHQMARHTWAAARLWQGVIGPADEPWLEGARVMATTRFDIVTSSHAKPNAEVIELAERLHEQAQQATALQDHASRARLYGEMMNTCASCHSIVRPQPVVRK